MTETDLLAERARVGLLHDIRPIPPGVALDMVQDVTGCRLAALAAIRGAMADSLTRDIPEPLPDGSPFSENRVTADAAVSNIRHGSDWLAAVCVGNLRGRANVMHTFPRDATESERGAAWLRWCSYAERYLGICRDLTEAANPVGAV